MNNTTRQQSEDLIAQYLLAHPKFFERHLEVLEQLNIPHPSGTAVSLLERQVQHLREQNGKLHQRLQELIKVARENDCLSRRMQTLNLMLIESRDLDEMIRGVHCVLRDEFSADVSILRLTGTSLPSQLDSQHQLSPALQDLFKPLLRGHRPHCGRLTKVQSQALFAEAADSIASAAVIPLAGHNWQGVLAIGSHDDQRFGLGMGTLFLSRLGELLQHAFNTQVYPIDSTAP